MACNKSKTTCLIRHASWMDANGIQRTHSCILVLGRDSFHHIIKQFACWVDLCQQLEQIADHLSHNIFWIAHLLMKIIPVLAVAFYFRKECGNSFDKFELVNAGNIT